jgi:hypothetical protein
MDGTEAANISSVDFNGVTILCIETTPRGEKPECPDRGDPKQVAGRETKNKMDESGTEVETIEFRQPEEDLH